MEIRRARPGDGPGIGQVHVASWRTTYKGIVPQEYLERLDAERRGAWWEEQIDKGTQPALWVATDADGSIVGFANGGASRTDQDRYSGELFAIYLLQSTQGSGIGRQLVRQVAADLWAGGHRSMIVGVLSDNPSRHFYERLGGQLAWEETCEIGGKELGERYYGWADLSVLL